jgi:predicted RNase H-like HicB family nuclease
MQLVPYTSELFEEDGQVVSVCRELNVSSYGDTASEAIDSLKEAVTLFLEECQRMGTLHTVLEEAGYSRKPGDSTRWVYRKPIQVNKLDAAVSSSSSGNTHPH